tara:strand:+ start:2920 stop:4749 length:1830 start_codon:yes stop_codon:yes gene_type:complete
MAEIAIPAIALGAMYILSNRNEEEEDDKNAEHFSNISAPNRRKLTMGDTNTGQPANIPTNYPVQTYDDIGTNPATYPAPNTATDRYFRQNVYEKKVENKEKVSNSTLFKSLTGNSVQKGDIKFNNMVPFFGSKVTQRTSDFGGNEGLLDAYTGVGSQDIQKKEQAPLFAPKENMTYAHGTPNQSEFIQSRMNPSQHMSNTKPWEEVRVGPGLNKGYTTEGSNGFNAGMEARDQWKDKTVDELRVKTNPKTTFGLANHEGPAVSDIKNRGFEGRVEKYRPDTYYINNPDRWFTTTGQEKAQRSRAEEPLQVENRPFTTREYFGASSTNQNASTKGRVNENYKRSTRPELAPNIKYMGGAHNLNYATGWKNLKENYGKGGYKSYPNARSTTQNNVEFGGVGGWIKAAITPILDIIRPSRKENAIGNIRQNGNAGGNYGVEQSVTWNPSDRTKTTIREQTEKTYDVSQPHYKRDGGYATAQYQPVENQRQSTNTSYTGNSSAAQGALNGPVYNAAYNAHLNPNKEKLLSNQMNVGCNPHFNANQNIKMSKIGVRHASQGPVNMPKESANMATYGEVGGRNTRGQTVDCNRNESDLLNAFNNNPFTKPLNSVA